MAIDLSSSLETSLHRLRFRFEEDFHWVHLVARLAQAGRMEHEGKRCLEGHQLGHAGTLDTSRSILVLKSRTRRSRVILVMEVFFSRSCDAGVMLTGCIFPMM